MEEEAKQELLLFHLARRIVQKLIFFAKCIIFAYLHQPTIQSFIRYTELSKCKEEKLKEGIFLPKQGNNKNGTVTFCVCAALMHYSNCGVFTDSKIDQILMMPPFLMVAYKDLRLWTLMLHPWIEKLGLLPQSLWEDTSYHHLLTWKIPQEHIHDCQVVMESGRNWRETTLPSLTVLSSCFMVISSWGQVLMTNCGLHPWQCDSCPWCGAQGTPPMLAGGALGSLGWWCLGKARKGAGDPKHPAVLLSSGIGQRASLGGIVAAPRRWALNCCSWVESDPGSDLRLRGSWSYREKRVTPGAKNKAHFKMTTERHQKHCWTAQESGCLSPW